MKKKSSKGFTVLELLVVIGILSILVALVLISLNSARKRSNDERKVAALRPVVIELREYFNICRQYPVNLNNPAENCPELQNQLPIRTVKDIIPDAFALNIDANDQNGVASKFHYVSLVDNGNPINSECTNFHVWVELDADNTALATQKSNKVDTDYTAANLSICSGNTTVPLNATTQSNKIFDIFK